MPVSAPAPERSWCAGLCSVRFYLCKRGRKPCSSPASLLPWTWKYGTLAATAIRVSGSPFKTLAEAEEACRSMVGLLPRTGRVAGNEAHVNFDAPAVLRKWPSLRNERRTEGTGPYLLVDGTLDECLRAFMAKPTSTRHLYEIHAAPQPPLVNAV